MEVKPGYKQTEVGVIPEAWDVDSLSSVTPKNARNGIVDGPFGSNLKTIHYRKSGIPIITSGYVTEGRFAADTYLYVDKDKFEEEKRSAVRPGDIVMAKIGARCGASAILPNWHHTGILSGNALKITVDEVRHSTFYVWQVLWDLYSAGRIEQLRTVGAQPAISMANLKIYKLALPPLPEQRAIAGALSDVDALIGALDQLIAKKRDLKQAAMQQLLTGKQRLPGFEVTSGCKQTEVGMIPEDWEAKTIDQVALVTSGKRLPLGCSLVEHPTPHPYVRVADMRPGTVSLSDIKFVPESVFPAIKRYRIFCEDIFISVAGTLGLVGKVPKGLDGANLTENADRITNITCSQDYLLHVLMSPLIQNAVDSIQTVGAQPKLALTRLRKFAIPFPTLREQSAIAEVLSDMDAELAALEQRRDKTRALKQGMMQELLTGRIRLA
ncbi:MAG: restriction endonuclease subunit S [Planctomycetota bacterium]|nr:restriction endonuclease subunit S [Planctomycetota bacterium]